MDYTPKLEMPELTSGQSGKEITHNEALRILDALVQAVVIDKDLFDEPAVPSDGDMYIVAAGSTSGDEWAGHENDLAYYKTSAWIYITPQDGWRVYVTDEQAVYQFDDSSGGGWIAVESSVGANSYDVGCSKAGKPDAGEILLRIPMTRSITFPDNFADSKLDAGTAADAQAVYSIKVNGAEVGTATVALGGSTATFATSAGEVALVSGDVLSIVAPGSQDATLADVGILLKGLKV